MSLASAAVNVVEAVTTLNARVLGKLGWYPAVIGFGGYGNPRRIRVMGRVLMGTRSDERNWLGERRGWRQYFDAQVPRQPVLLRVGDIETVIYADRGGYVDHELDIPPLKAGWNTVQLQVLHRTDMLRGIRPVRASQPVGVPIRIVGEQERVGIISDVDDTVMITMVPKPLMALRYVLLEHATRRQSVRGMAVLLKSLQFLGLRIDPPASHSPMPAVFYLSNGAWNVVPTLRRFLTRTGMPRGTLLLRPWGINAHGLPPSGTVHKLRQFGQLKDLLPNLKWFLVGDDGERDPEIYEAIERQYPGSVLGILVRTLSEPEHIALHGTPFPLHPASEERPGDPMHLSGRDGHELQRYLYRPETLKDLRGRVRKPQR